MGKYLLVFDNCIDYGWLGSVGGGRGLGVQSAVSLNQSAFTMRQGWLLSLKYSRKGWEKGYFYSKIRQLTLGDDAYTKSCSGILVHNIYPLSSTRVNRGGDIIAVHWADPVMHSGVLIHRWLIDSNSVSGISKVNKKYIIFYFALNSGPNSNWFFK